jgi:hypothetical protein
MRIAAISSLMGFASSNSDRSSIAPAQPDASDRAATIDRTLRPAAAVIVVALLNVTCVLWIYPLANQLAEWAGVSFLNAIYVGLGTMLGSVPFILAATILIWRRKAK